ncbi:MAG: hypothetical protein GSR80_000974 [Desulfurococcales archaeon]|nr:hypothetical protein [Desulfurococcales archaeon]
MGCDSLPEGLQGLVRGTPRGVALEVYVVPRAGESRLAYRDGELVYYSEAKCKGHAVNYDLLKWLSRNIGGRPRIVRGWSSRVKLVLLEGVTLGEALEALCSNLDRGGVPR